MSSSMPPHDANGAPPGNATGVQNPSYGTEAPPISPPTFAADSNKVNTLTLKFSIPAVNNGVVKPSPFISKFFQILQKTDPTAQILPKSNAAHLTALMTANDIPNDADGISDYASDLQHDTRRNQHAIYLCICTQFCFTEIKHNTLHMYSWLVAKRIWILLHKHSSKNLRPIGWVKFMDATLGSRENLKTILDHHLGGKETSFSLDNEFVWKDNKKIVVKVVAIMADVTGCINIFTDAELVGLGNKELIPFPRKGVMEPEPHHNVILEHYNYCKAIAAISITGRFFKKNTNMIPTRSNSQHVKTILRTLLEEITDKHGVPYFTSLEPTKFSAMKGRYLLFTKKERAMAAMKAFDDFVVWLYANMLHEPFVFPNMRLCRTHTAADPKIASYAAKIAEKHSSPPPCRPQFAIPAPPSNQVQTHPDICHFHQR